MKQEKKELGITAKKDENTPEWYEQVCLKGEMAEFGPVKGTMIIRPNGYAIWEAIQTYFNENIIKKTKTRNAYFPLFIPESFFKKEAEHAEGFSPEVAWLDKSTTGEGERIALRPTSETIMYDAYSKWIRNYKDLPLRINQWCNVIRWETEATKLFLRSREFLWQEGHCVYETEEECFQETLGYIKAYAELCKNLLAFSPLIGEKTEKERFAGADKTFTIEALMPDGKALQCGTSHLLSVGFAKAFNITYIGKDEKPHFPRQNSWGLSTRLLGATIMTHSDNKGLVLPPRVAENKLVIIPIILGEDKTPNKKAEQLKKELEIFNPILDSREDHSAGFKFSEWEMKGIPLRIEIGPRDIKENKITLVRRNNGKKETLAWNKDLVKNISRILEEIHEEMLKKAEQEQEKRIIEVKDIKEMIKVIKDKKMALANFCGSEKCEDWIKDKTEGASTRCIPFDKKLKPNAKCIYCNKAAKYPVYFSRSY